ncbi:DUF1579 domain-containing protein [Polluticoccus soli]|uniref:DUF1579 domain-containing protein n=1 Tax=Polluticoccus soli TaxID=3034150 RepID=UPI0023E29E7C|nr:DUF1579 domain-containing protein [Flavipsychrobacter sp. JY13-12]
MKQLSITLAALCLLTFAACDNATKEESTGTTDTVVATTATPAETTPEPPADSATMAKAWQDYMTPGPMHKWMESTNGKWDADFTFWMGPDAPPDSGSKATVENKTILGGRYQESIYKGTMMGGPFEGKGTMAYDNAKKKFINTWIDNMGTGLMHMEGTYDEATKTLNMSGTGVDPVSGKDVAMRQVLKTIDDKHQLMEMYDTKGGREYKSMEIRLTKK